MLRSWLSACLLPTLAYSVNVTFYESKGCSGPRLFGDAIQQSLPCYNISGHAPTNSSSVEDFVPGQEVFFYSDAECQQEVFSSQDDLCYLHTRTTVRAVKVRSGNATVDDDDAATNSSTTDIALYEMQWSGEPELCQLGAPLVAPVAL